MRTRPARPVHSALFAGACLAGLALPSAAFAAAPVAPTLEQAFHNPPAQARPRFRWWWPGDAVSTEELEHEIALAHDAGFGGLEIQSVMPNGVQLTADQRARVNNYAEPSFFAHVRKAGAAAAARGMSLDYTFGSSWPSGGGLAVPPEKALTELTMARTEVVAGATGPIRLTLPPRTRRMGALSAFDPRVKDPRVADWGARMDAQAGIEAVVAMRGEAPQLVPPPPPTALKLSAWTDVIKPGRLDPASVVVLTDRLRPDGTLDWTPPPGTWQVFVFKRYASNMGVLGAAGQGPQLVLDHFDKTAFAAHAARVGDPLGRNPVGLRSTFVDSLELMQDLPWGRDFVAQFKARRGYDLTPYLALVVQPGWMQAWNDHWSPPYFNADDALADRVRTDYRRTVSDLLFDNFLLPFVNWNHAHGLKAKFQAHGGAIDVLRGYGVADIPETEDLVGADPLFMRFARSAANLYGRPIVSAESLVWKDRPYNVTPDEMRRRADLNFAGGVNAMIVHGLDYKLDEGNWPGWHAFQPTTFSLGFSTMLAPANPIWAAVPMLGRYIGRTQAVLQQGRPVVPVAYFYGQTGYYVGIEDGGAGKQAAERAFIAGGYDFDRINPDSIAGARVVGRRLVSRGGASYPVLVLPPLDGIRAETVERIAAFAKAGLPVLFTDRAPTRDEGLADAARRDARVRAAVAAALRSGARVVPAGDVVPSLRARGIAANLRFTGTDASDLVFVQRQAGSRRVTFVVNRGASARDAGLVLPGLGGVTRWNAMDGTVAPVDARREGAATRVSLRLAPGESALLVLDPATAPRAVPVPVVAQTIPLPATGWSLSVDGHSGRTAYRHDFGPAALGDWREVPELARFSGTGTYRLRFALTPAQAASGKRVTLDLGAVHDMATVTVNGRTLAPAIGSPFRVDLSGLVHSGDNTMSVTIANTPQNAMIDPASPAYRGLKPVPAGLVGPVTLEVAQ